MQKNQGRAIPMRQAKRIARRSKNCKTPLTAAESPQTNGIVERFHKTMLNEFYRIAFRKKLYGSIEELQADLDQWFEEFNRSRPHQERWCKRRCRPSLTQSRLRRKK
jgi:transposase InsO family protein